MVGQKAPIDRRFLVEEFAPQYVLDEVADPLNPYKECIHLIS